MNKQIEELKDFVLESVNTVSVGKVTVVDSKDEVIELIHTKYDSMFIPHLFTSQKSEPQFQQIAWSLAENPKTKLHKSTCRHGFTGQSLLTEVSLFLKTDFTFKNGAINTRAVQYFKQKVIQRVNVFKKAMQDNENIEVLVYVKTTSNGIEFQMIPVYSRFQTIEESQYAYHEQAQYLRSQYALKLIEIEDGINTLSQERKNVKKALDRGNYHFKDADYIHALSQVHDVVNSGRISRKSSIPVKASEFNQEAEKFRELVELTLKSKGTHVFTDERFRGLGLTTLVVNFALTHEMPMVVANGAQRDMVCNNFNIPQSQVITTAEINSDVYRGRTHQAVVVDCIDMFDPALKKLDELGVKYFGFLRKYN